MRALDKRLLFVTGKGGVGRSTVAGALGLLAARRGRRTIVAEVAAQDRIARAFAPAPGAPRGLEERELAPNLFACSVDPQAALEEYLVDQLPSRALAETLSASRVFGYFAAATPGMRELVTVGKLWELAQPDRRTPGAEGYDLVVVDAPATGHGVGILRTPSTFAELARVGPVARQGRIIHDTLADPAHTGVVAVTTAAEMPVTETLQLQRALREAPGLELDAVVVNRLLSSRFAPAELAPLRAALAEHPGDPAARAALRVALQAEGHARFERAQLARLRRATALRPAVLPLLVDAEPGLGVIERLADALEAGA
jgi:anion-transporting  ArsA/GET3 family ATPase